MLQQRFFTDKLGVNCIGWFLFGKVLIVSWPITVNDINKYW